MRKLASLAALLAAIATPAWARNDTPAWAMNDEIQGITLLNSKAYDVCYGAGTSSSICGMNYVSEADALTIALSTIERCADSDTVFSAVSATCVADLAYIKQRWGY